MPTDLVLLHGGLYNSSCWDAVVAAFGETSPCPFGRVLQLDMPGHGTKRGRDTTAMSRDDVVSELDADIRTAGFTSPVLVGHSVAGTLLTELAARSRYAGLCFVTTAILEPGQVAADIFIDAPHGSDPDHVGYPADPAHVSSREMDRLRFCLDMAPDEAGAWLDDCHNDIIPRAVMNTPGKEIDPRSLPPMTYVIATRNPVFPVEWQERFADRLGTDVRRTSIDSGHAPFFTRPRELAQLLCRLYEDGQDARVENG
jgi:pimeloyl-ACP methyl ester carboxylesterase